MYHYELRLNPLETSISSIIILFSECTIFVCFFIFEFILVGY